MKRVKVQSTSSKNPLFEKWLLEWKMNAAEHGSEMQYSFGRALRSLQKYPFQLRSGKECIILEYFGKKICEMIDKKLEDLRKTLTEAEWAQLCTAAEFPVSSQIIGGRSKSSPTRKKRKGSVQSTLKNGEDPKFGGSASQERSASVKHCSPPSGYIPKYRSGAYALLLTLYKASSGKAPMTKGALQKEAQSLCDASFTKPLPGGFYTAWSSMATLTKKKLVTKAGKPIKYELTAEGVVLAGKLSSLTEDDFRIFSADTPPLSPERPQPPHTLSKSTHNSPSVSSLLVSADSGSSVFRRDLNYDWLDNVGNQVSSSSFQPISSSVMVSDLNYGKVPETSCEKSWTTACESSLPLPSSVFSRDLNSDWTSTKLLTCTSTISKPPVDSLSSSGGSSLSSETHSGISQHLVSNHVPSSVYASSRGNRDTASCGPQSESNSGPLTSSDEFTEPHETVFFFPGQFQIILLVDIHETEMRGRERTAASVDHLGRLGVVCETRHLSVGDFVWIARDSVGVELTLPYVIERKRMDDMASSIKDGRFHEQKFRLKGSGVPYLIYLVESHGSKQRLGLPLETLQQAAVNTQVVDEFTVKYSKSHIDSMLYLSCMTKLLIKLYKDKTLMSCPKKNLLPPDLTSDLVSLMFFKQFNKDSTKVKNHTVKEMLLKQLIQLNGVSVDKAAAIVERFPTPLLLTEALQNGGEKILAGISIGPLRRLGPALAKSITQFYTQETLH